MNLPDEYRERHVYIIGAARFGKTNLMQNLIAYDIQAGHGVAYIDPHGDSGDEILSFIPEERLDDVIYFEPATLPIGIDFLHCDGGDYEKQLIAGDMYSLFEAAGGDITGPRMDAILRTSIATLLMVPGSTFLDMYYMLSSDDYLFKKIEGITNPAIMDFWKLQWTKLPPNTRAEGLLTRLQKFVIWPSLQTLLGTRNGIRIPDLMDDGKVIIVNLKKLDLDTKALIGTLIISQVQLAGMRRASVHKSRRRPFYLYVDEFQNFATTAFQRIVSEAGKFALRLCIAHQDFAQIDEKTRRSLLGNITGAKIAFRVQPADARLIADSFTKRVRYKDLDEPHVDANEFVQLSRFHTIVKMGDEEPFKAKTVFNPPPKNDMARKVRERMYQRFAPQPAPIVPIKQPTPGFTEPTPSPPPKKK